MENCGYWENDCIKNAKRIKKIMERFYNTFKSNFYNVTSFSSVEMMDELTMNYINWYNYVRPHSYNDYLTPMEARYR